MELEFDLTIGYKGEKYFVKVGSYCYSFTCLEDLEKKVREIVYEKFNNYLHQAN